MWWALPELPASATIEPLIEQLSSYADSGQRQFTELVYQADSWDRERRMVASERARVQPSLCGHQPPGSPDHYNQCENFVKQIWPWIA